MPPRSLAAVAALLAIPALARPDPALLAALESEQTRLFEAVAPAVVVVGSGPATSAGFAVAPGLVVTAAHAVAGEPAVDVTLHDGRILRGEVLERARDGLDLALLRIPETPAALLDLAAPAPVRAGTVVLAVGHDDGARWSLSTGIVSNPAADGPDGALVRLQLPARAGASGGPVVDRAGRLVGVVTHGAAGVVAYAVRTEAVVRAFPWLGEVIAHAGHGWRAVRARAGP